MSNINNPERLKVPLKDKDGYFYPITSYNQIVMPDGTFWNGETPENNGVYVDRTGSVVGPAAPVNADTLGGTPAREFAKNTDEKFVPAGGTQSQVLVKIGDEDFATGWENKEYDHTHAWSDIQEKPTAEEWTLIMEDGTSITKKVLIDV